MLLLNNKLFFKVFIVCLVFYALIGLFYGFSFFLNACFMAFSTLILHLINAYGIIKKIINYKMIFKPAPHKSKIFIYEDKNQIKRKKIFFTTPKILIYVIIGLWIYTLASINALSVFGILVGSATTAVCSIAQGFFSYRR